MASVLEYILSGELLVDTLVSFLKRNQTDDIVIQKVRTKVIWMWEGGGAMVSYTHKNAIPKLKQYITRCI